MPSSRTVSANGIEIFLLEEGEGPLVVLCHGWPELSYSWRHQIAALAAAGFHVAAPDMRGFGRTSAPADIGAYSIFDTVGDMVALVAALGAKRATIIGHDWGAPVAWHAALFRPDIFSAVAGLSVPPPLRGRGRPLDTLRESGITNFYWQYFQTPALPKPSSSAMLGWRCEPCLVADFPIQPPCLSKMARAFSVIPAPTGRCRIGSAKPTSLISPRPTGSPASAA